MTGSKWVVEVRSPEGEFTLIGGRSIREHLPRRHVKRHVAQDHWTVFHPDIQVADLKITPHRSTGSKRSFNPSPSCEKLSTVRNSVISGKTSTHHA